MLTDQELYIGCQKGSEDAQKRLYHKFAPKLKGIAVRYMQEPAAASDVLQESFIKIFNTIKNFKGDGSLEGWMKRIVINTALDHLKRKKNTQKWVFLLDERHQETIQETEAEDTDIVHLLMEVGFDKKLLIDVLHKLPQNYATAFNLFFIDGISHREIASSMQITENLSRKWVFRAKELIKVQLLQHLSLNLKTTY